MSNATQPIWPTEKVIQFKETFSTLEAAKAGAKTTMIIGDTGYTKTYSIDKFCQLNSTHTFRVTVSSLYKLVDIINELGTLTGINYDPVISGHDKHSSLKARLDAIVEKVRLIKEQGGYPIIIFDEGENLQLSVLKMLKALYDALKDFCSIVLIGTDQLLTKLRNLRKRNRDGIPQLYSRFKMGTVTLTPINRLRDFKPFFDRHIPGETALQGIILERCENYRELHDALYPALLRAQQLGQPLTEKLFRLVNNMP